MNTWFTSDTHLGHTNIIDYCKRPFWTTADRCQLCKATSIRRIRMRDVGSANVECHHPDVELHDRVIIERWNERVQPDDIVYHLGDFAFGNFARIAGYAKRLNGKKVLVQGNHDRLSVNAFTRMGFLVRPQMRVGSVHLSHRPPWPVSAGRLYLCGHIHGLWKEKKHELLMAHPARVVNVGVDVRDFRPVSAEELGFSENLLK